MLSVTYVLMLLLTYASSLDEGSDCTNKGRPGVCKLFTDCFKTAEEFKNKTLPEICSFKGTENVIVCCENKTDRNILRTLSQASSSSESDEELKNCPPIPPEFATTKTGSKALEKCIEYQEKAVYPCVNKNNYWTRENRCYQGKYANENVHLIIGVGGKDAKVLEFPNVVLLGYGEDSDARQWLCGGVVISERFILTAGHCTSTRDWGNVTHVAAEILKRDDVHENVVYSIKRIIKHPEYRPPSKYNDIALLETDRPFEFSRALIPACLHSGFSVEDRNAVAIGWGALSYKGPKANVLQKGDSGGPLMIEHPTIRCMWCVLGITTFGTPCGNVGQPGIYTRVEPYISWIENIVWP
ncbi:venom protease-like isoform 2-T6 [Aphomia sociella]